MPELPEVETVCRILRDNGLIGSYFSHIEIKKNPHLIKEPTADEFVSNLLGKKIEKIERKGKWLIFYLDNNWVLLNHLRMSGKYFFAEVFNEGEHDISLIFRFKKENNQISNNEGVTEKKLIYCDSRRFSVFYLQPRETFYSLLPYKSIGPDIIQEKITPDLIARFKNLRIPIKAALLDQKIVSGIGNIYATEILFVAQIHPEKITKTLAPAEIEKILQITQDILHEAIEMGGTSEFDFINPLNKIGYYQQKLKVYNRTGKPCFSCGELIRRIELNGRGTFFCPKCQKNIL
jgi:formamidopyrimidine-DNA glycosylase